MRPAIELSEVRAVTGVAFQQAPEYAADDLVLRAVSRKEQDDVTEMPIAVRRTPKLTEGDEKSEQLIAQVLQVATQAAHRPQTRTVAIAVAGSRARRVSFTCSHTTLTASMRPTDFSASSIPPPSSTARYEHGCGTSRGWSRKASRRCDSRLMTLRPKRQPSSCCPI